MATARRLGHQRTARSGWNILALDAGDSVSQVIRIVVSSRQAFSLTFDCFAGISMALSQLLLTVCTPILAEIPSSTPSVSSRACESIPA